MHGQHYDYSRVIYKNAATKIEIICKQHGSFSQRPNNHTSHKQGCPQCERLAKAKRNRERTVLTKKEFQQRAEVIHGKVYDYTNVCYIASHKPIEILCPTHGLFRIARAEKHLTGQACPTCSSKGSFVEERIAKALTERNIVFIRQKKFDNCRSPFTNRKLVFDFYIPSKNLLLEYDGEQHFKQSPLFHKNNRFERFKIHDETKTQFARQCEYRLLRMSFREAKTLLAFLDTELQ